MFKIYFILQDQIDKVKALLNTDNTMTSQLQSVGSFFNFSRIALNIGFVVLESLVLMIKFLIIVLADTSKAFDMFFNNQRDALPVSYHQYKKMTRRIRLFSFSGVAAILLVVVFSSFVFDYFWAKFGQAATFGWQQTSWDAAPTPGFVAQHNLAAWGNASTTAYESRDSLIMVNNPAPGDSNLSLATTTGGITQTDNSITLSGFNLSGAQLNQTYITPVGTNGDNAKITLGTAAAPAVFTLGQNLRTSPSFVGPGGIFADKVNNKIYVADTYNHRVVRFDSGTGGTTRGANFQTFGSMGNASGQFLYPSRLVVDPAYQLVFVADTNNGRIDLFNFDNNSLGANFASVGGFWQPTGLFIDTTAHKLYLADKQNNRVVILNYTSNSLVVDKVITGSSFSLPEGVAVDQVTGKIYVADTNNNRIQRFNIDGAGAIIPGSVEEVNGLNGPSDLAIQPNAKLYVSDTKNNNLVMVDISGSNFTNESSLGGFVGLTGAYFDGTDRLYVADSGSDRVVSLDAQTGHSTFGQNQTTVGGAIYGVNQFKNAKDIFSDQVNNKVFVVDDKRLAVFDSGFNGTVMGGSWQEFSSSTNVFRGPTGVFVDTDNHKVYIADSNRIVRFDSGANGSTLGANWQEVAVGIGGLRDIYVDAISAKAYFFQTSAGQIYLTTMDAGSGTFGQNMHNYGSRGSGNGQFTDPRSLYVSTKNDRIFVTEQGKVVNFKLNVASSTLDNWQEKTLGTNLNGLWFDDRSGSLYVSDLPASTIWEVQVDENSLFGSVKSFGGNFDNSNFYPQTLSGDSLNNKLFIIDYGWRLVRMDIDASVNTYYPTGSYVSGVIDTGQKNLNWSSINWSQQLNGQIMTIKLRSGNNPDLSDASNWSACANAAKGQSLASYSCVKSSDRYYQYSVAMTSSQPLESPVLYDLTVNYDYYPSNQALTSAIYNTGDPNNVVGPISWFEASSSGFVGANAYIRIASSAEEIASSTWQAVASSSCDKNNTSGEVTCPINAIPSVLKQGQGAQYYQYKINLLSPGNVSPRIYSVLSKYIINIAPIVETVGEVAQSTDGKIALDYDVLDLDTVSGVMPNQAVIGLDYWNGFAWVRATSSALVGDTGLQAITAATSSIRHLVWDPQVDFPGQYFATSSNFRVRVTAYDGEIANNTGYGYSNPLRLDTKAPSVASATVDASNSFDLSGPVTVNLNSVDDSNFKQKVSVDLSVFAPLTWLTFDQYVATTSINTLSLPGTVYFQMMDEYQNRTAIQTLVIPETPTNGIIRDLTNANAGINQLFLAWVKATSSAPFKQYDVWRSIDGTNFELHSTIPDRTNNFFFDSNTLDQNVTYYYKVTTEDLGGNISRYEKVLSKRPDGLVADLSNITVTSMPQIVATTTQSATISWETDKLSNSTIGFSTATGTFVTEVGVATMVDNASSAYGPHIVTVTGLQPNTTYYYRVKSQDEGGNIVIENNGGAGFSFTTKAGPAIIGPVTFSATNNQAIVSWQTDLAASTAVVYSASTSMAASVEVTDDTAGATTTHNLILPNLNEDTDYYFYVKSKDADGNETLGRDFVDGSYVNYHFKTLKSSTMPPEATSTVCQANSDTDLQINWSTVKPAYGQVYYGLLSGNYASSTGLSSALNLTQSINITGLVASTTYYYITVSVDQYGNVSTSTEGSCQTAEQLTTEAKAKQREQAAKDSGFNQGYQAGYVPPVTSAGGGMIIIDKTDKRPPVISNILANKNHNGVIISWLTDELANSFVEYGTSTDYGDYYGANQLLANHTAELKHLEPETTYHYRVSSADSWGNIASSTDQMFTTGSALPELISSTTEEANVKDENIKKLITGLKELILSKDLSSALVAQYDLLDSIASKLRPPVIYGEPVVVVSSKSAIISWSTDRETNSLVALSTDDAYKINAQKAEPYVRTDGDPFTYTKDHRVVVADLVPNTVYHFQVRNKAKIGPIAKSKDLTFTTNSESLEISDDAIEVLPDNRIKFKWLTSGETNTIVEYTPYRGNILAIEEAKAAIDKNLTKVHEIIIPEVEAGVAYQVVISGVDKLNRKISKILPTFNSKEDKLPPEIKNIRAESSMSQGKNPKVVSIISWNTDKPTITQLFYQKGVIKDFATAESMPLETNYTKNHTVVMTRFTAGQVYTFIITAVDSVGNRATSTTHTLLAPHQSEGIIELLLRNFESTFGWLKNIGK